MTLTTAIITYNEEKRIRECIQSVHDISDEVLVLDSFSTDKTASIAQEFSKVRFLQHPFDGHVQQKNRAIDLAQGTWVLSIDADERLTPQLARSVVAFLNDYPEASGAQVRRLTWHLGRFIRYGGWYNVRYRLIRKGQAQWAGENPHDEIRLNRDEHKRGTGLVLDGDLFHYSFIDLSDQVNTINKFSSIVAFNRHGKGRRFFLFKLIFKPISKFIETYCLKGGFLDGMPGFIIAVSSSYSTFLKWAKMYELEKTGIERPSNVRPDYQVQSEGTGE